MSVWPSAGLFACFSKQEAQRDRLASTVLPETPPCSADHQLLLEIPLAPAPAKQENQQPAGVVKAAETRCTPAPGCRTGGGSCSALPRCSEQEVHGRASACCVLRVYPGHRGAFDVLSANPALMRRLRARQVQDVGAALLEEVRHERPFWSGLEEAAAMGADQAACLPMGDVVKFSACNWQPQGSSQAQGQGQTLLLEFLSSSTTSPKASSSILGGISLRLPDEPTRSQHILEDDRFPSAVTMITQSGLVLSQNPASLQYWGDLRGSFSAGGLPRCVFLQHLFSLQPQLLNEFIEEVAVAGREWHGVLRVPAHGPQVLAPEAQAAKRDGDEGSVYGGHELQLSSLQSQCRSEGSRGLRLERASGSVRRPRLTRDSALSGRLGKTTPPRVLSMLSALASAVHGASGDGCTSPAASGPSTPAAARLPASARTTSSELDLASYDAAHIRLPGGGGVAPAPAGTASERNSGGGGVAPAAASTSHERASGGDAGAGTSSERTSGGDDPPPAAGTSSEWTSGGDDVLLVSGPPTWHEVSSYPLVDPLTHVDCFLLLQADVTERATIEATVAKLMESQLKMLCGIFPRHIIEFLCISDMEAVPENYGKLARSHENITVMFMDVVGFTSMCKEVEPTLVMTFLNQLFTRFDLMLDEFKVQKVETAGDAYICACGILEDDGEGFLRTREAADPVDSARRVMAFAKAILRCSQQVVMPHNGEAVAIRIGLHTGPCVTGLVGIKLPKFSVFGDTMNTASRMESTSRPGCIQVSATTWELLSGYGEEQWEATGGVEIKGKGMMKTFFWSPPPSSGFLQPAEMGKGSPSEPSRSSSVKWEAEMEGGLHLSGAPPKSASPLLSAAGLPQSDRPLPPAEASPRDDERCGGSGAGACSARSSSARLLPSIAHIGGLLHPMHPPASPQELHPTDESFSGGGDGAGACSAENSSTCLLQPRNSRPHSLPSPLPFSEHSESLAEPLTVLAGFSARTTETSSPVPFIGLPRDGLPSPMPSSEHLLCLPGPSVVAGGIAASAEMGCVELDDLGWSGEKLPRPMGEPVVNVLQEPTASAVAAAAASSGGGGGSRRTSLDRRPLAIPLTSTGRRQTSDIEVLREMLLLHSHGTNQLLGSRGRKFPNSSRSRLSSAAAAAATAAMAPNGRRPASAGEGSQK